MSGHLVHVPARERSRMGRATLVAKHNLADSPLFADDALVELLDNHPRDRIVALTMGTDVGRPDENRLAIHQGVSGAELLRQ